MREGKEGVRGKKKIKILFSPFLSPFAIWLRAVHFSDLSLSFFLSLSLSFSPVLSCHSNLCENSSQRIEAFKKKKEKAMRTSALSDTFPPPLRYAHLHFTALEIPLCPQVVVFQVYLAEATS